MKINIVILFPFIYQMRIPLIINPITLMLFSIRKDSSSYLYFPSPKSSMMAT